MGRTSPLTQLDGLVLPVGHPIVIDGKGTAAANVLLDVNLSISSRSLSLGAGDTLTIGTGRPFGKGRVSLAIKQPGDILTNLGTIGVSNYSSLKRDSLATIDNVRGAITVACRGSTPAGITEKTAVQESCLWDGGGSTNDWSEAAN